MPKVQTNLGSFMLPTTEGPTIAFGKYRGTLLKNVPGGYLRFCLAKMDDLPEEFIAAVEEVLEEKHARSLSFDFDEEDYDEDFR